jgi:glucose/arabinose dehydrogenase/mono/diheme cytochrome c family protein
MRYIMLLLWLLVLAGCGAAVNEPVATPTAISDSEAVMTLVAATQTAELENPPTLRSPEDGAVFENPVGVSLAWDWIRPLQGDEVYDVRVWREGAPHYGITWSPASHVDMLDWLRAQEPGDFYWSIAVIVAGEEGKVEREVSREAAPFKFTVNSTSLPTPTPIPESQIIEVPERFAAKAYAEPTQATLPTTIEFGPDGALYMLTLGGDIFKMTDQDGDHYAETVERIYFDGEDQLQHAIGLAFHDGTMYISDSGRISTFEDSDDDGMLDKLTPIVEGLVTLEYPFHSNNGIAFGPDDKLYIGVGATSDHGPLEKAMEASILRMNPDGSQLEVFASGLRNPYDLTFAPNGDLFTADNNPDLLDENLRWLPPEELNFIREGRDYGFPDAYGKQSINGSEAAITEFFPSVASSGLDYYDGDQFPAGYQGRIFVALWGTAAPTPQERSITNGRMVIVAEIEPTDDGGYTGDWDVFAWFDQSADYRPIDVTVGPDGALYIAEWSTSTVYRVEYVGDQGLAVADVPTPTPAPTLQVSADMLALGEAIYKQGAQEAPPCIACHVLEADGPTGVGPILLGLNEIAAERVDGLSAVAYVRRSITHPNEYISPGYSAGYMYQDYGQRLTDDQIDALVAYVLSLE